MSDPLSEDCSKFGLFFVAGLAEQRPGSSRPASSLAGAVLIATRILSVAFLHMAAIASGRRPGSRGLDCIRDGGHHRDFIHHRLALLPTAAHVNSFALSQRC